MNSVQLFTLALGLAPPWYVERIDFDKNAKINKRLDIYLRFKKGSNFKDKDGDDCRIHDTQERSWQHLNFFEHTCYLHAKVPRIIDKDGKVVQVSVPWARPQSGFTLLFEAFSMCLIESEMPVNKAANIMHVYPQRLWTIFNYWIKRAFQNDDQTGIECIGIDETSRKRGHSYVTINVDLEKKRVIYACKGKDEKTVDKLKAHLEGKGVLPEQIKHISMDMSPAFISGVTRNFPQAAIVFDHFHITKMLNEAVDEVRKQESRIHKAIKGHKYTFLKNNKNLSTAKLKEKYRLMEVYPALGETVRLRELFNDFWEYNNVEEASGFLAYWCDLAHEYNIGPMIKFANSIKTHWSGVINYVQRKISNGVLEGINSKIQLAKRRARGYRNITNFINMIYFIAGKLKFDYPHYFT
jgi:transposase